ncbi:MAG: TMEM165/GDT1 family protein [Actinobacteria bacterium]|nr:TMEM165/GDT1 family protein [Actinomycetota bacterium]
MLKVILIVFLLQFLLELPDKTMIAMIYMGTRARPLNVFIGGAVAFTVHMAIAVGAGGLLTLLPHTPKEIVIATLFLVGAFYLLFVSEKEEEEEGEKEAQAEHPGKRWREMGTAFSVIFIGEFGDLTQIQAANLTVKYHDVVDGALAVFIGSSLALILIAFLGAFGGKALVRILPLAKIRKIGGVVFLGMGIWTIVQIFQSHH